MLFSPNHHHVMGLFSNKPTNRRRRRRRAPERDWIDESGSSAPRKAPKAPEHPREQVHKLHAQIGALESFLQKHHQAEKARLIMKTENILPPPDRSAHRNAKRVMTHAARRRYLAERNRTGLRFLMLFCTACGLAWWLIFSGM